MQFPCGVYAVACHHRISVISQTYSICRLPSRSR